MTDLDAARSVDAARSGPTLRLPGALELGEAVTLAVREMILSGAVAPGERLVETELATRFGTSRGPVRDAFKELEKVGLVKAIPRRGTFVATMDAQAIDEVYTMRIALEGLAITRFAPRATNDEVQGLRDAVDALAEAERGDDPLATSRADMALHRTIVIGAKHDRLHTAWEQVADQTMLILNKLALHRPDIQAAAGDHTVIVDAIAANSVKAAEKALHKHLSAAHQAMLQLVDD